MSIQIANCACGHTELEVTGKPKFRMLCHCGICRKYNKSSHADILVYQMTQVKVSASSVVNFQTYKRPPNVQRGQCSKCGQAAIEVFNMPLMPKLTMVPAGMFAETAELPKPKAHMFYDKRVQDTEDDLPKKTGFVASQLAFFKYLWFPKRK